MLCRFMAAHKKLSDWLFASLICGFGLPLSFFFWYFNLYKGAIRDSSFRSAAHPQHSLVQVHKPGRSQPLCIQSLALHCKTLFCYDNHMCEGEACCNYSPSSLLAHMHAVSEPVPHRQTCSGACISSCVNCHCSCCQTMLLWL